MFFFLYIYLTEIKIYRLVNAATGTGKTVAYLAPIIHHLHSYPSRIDRENGTFGM
jgi:ATP-dependent RNA helicase DDX31/DBP7